MRNQYTHRLRPYAPNIVPPQQPWALGQGVGRLLERLSTPSGAWLGLVGSHGERHPLRTPAQWDELGRAQDEVARRAVELHPATFGEAAEHYDEVRRVVTTDANDDGLFIEVARVRFIDQGLGVLERLHTWARVTDVASSNTVELRTPLDQTNAAATVSGVPFPFPLTLGANAFTIAWALVFTNLGQYQDPPAFVGPTVGGIPPVGVGIPRLPARWADQRYSWGSRGADGHRWQFSQNGLLRLFATVTAPRGAYTVELAARLGGYNQLAGVRHASLFNATLRG